MLYVLFVFLFLDKTYYTVNGKVANDASKIEFVVNGKASIFTPIDHSSTPAGTLEVPVSQETDPKSVKYSNGNIDLVKLTVPVAPTEVSLLDVTKWKNSQCIIL